MRCIRPWLFWTVVAGWALTVALLVWLCTPAGARDLGQWNDVPEEVRYWYGHLLQPDTLYSCCGEADAYYADETRVENGKIIAIITDDRPDEPLKRLHEPIGAEYEVPPNKIVDNKQAVKGNPTGHVIIFLGGRIYAGGDDTVGHRSVLCYVLNSGV